MAISQNMQDELDHMREDQLMRRAEHKKISDEMDGKENGPLSTDPRVISVFGTGSEFLDRDFIKAYVSGQPHKREPYLTDIFDGLQSYRWNPDITAGNAIESDLASIVDHSNKFCYLQNLISDNKDYYESHFPNPQDRIALDAAVDMNTCITPLISHVLAENSYSYNLEHLPPEALRQPDTKASAMLRAQTAGYVYRQQMDTLDGRTPDSTLNLKFDEGINRSLCFIGKDLDKARKQLASGKEKPNLRAGIWLDAAGTFDSIFNAISPATSQGKEQARLGLDQFDMIYIDGKSVREACGEKYRNASPSDLNILMKGEVIQAMTSGRNRVEMATVQRDKENHAHLSINSVEADIRAIEPTVKEDYSAIRRLFNRGPFRCKTRTERMETLKNQDEGREQRRADMAENFRVKIQRLNQQADKDAKNRSLGASAQQRVKAHEILTSLKGKTPARRLPPFIPRSPLPVKHYNHEDYFGSQEYYIKDENNQDIRVPFNRYVGDPVWKENIGKIGITQRMSTDVYAAIDIRVMGNADEMITLEQMATNPSSLAQLRQKEAAALLKVGRGNTVGAYNTKAYAQAGVRICSQPLPDVSSPVSLAENYQVLETMEAVTRTWFSTQAPLFKYAVDDCLKNGSLNDSPITPERIRETIGFMKTYSQNALVLSQYYMSPAGADPDAKMTDEIPSILAGKAALDALREAAPGEGLDPKAMNADQSREYRQIMDAAGKAAKEACKEARESYDRKNSDILMHYLRGDGPNPFRRSEKGDFVFDASLATKATEHKQAPENRDRRRSSLDSLMDEEKKPDVRRAAYAPQQRTRVPQPVREKGGKDEHAL